MATRTLGLLVAVGLLGIVLTAPAAQADATAGIGVCIVPLVPHQRRVSG